MQSTSADLREFLRNPPHETVRNGTHSVAEGALSQQGENRKACKVAEAHEGRLPIHLGMSKFFPPEAIHPVKPKGGKQLTPEVVAREQDDPLCGA